MKDWLGKTRRIQIEEYDNKLGDLSPEEHRAYVWTNVLSAHAELTEALEETNWKPWANLTDNVVPDRTAFIRELVDATMFIANLAASVECTDTEWDAIYKAKWKVNIERQRREGGYVSRRGIDKCTLCARSFDDVGQAGESSFCVKCVGTAVTGE